MPASSTDSSAILALPYLQPSQAQKHVTHNQALCRLDVLVQLSVEGFGATTPPAAPAEGEAHALGAAPTGAWAGQADSLAAWVDGAWMFIAPQTGWRAWGRAERQLRVWEGAAWVLPAADLENVSGLGIATASDATNRLAVKSPATLLSHDGTDHRLKINKAAAADTASVLFQSGFAGHAEIGLAGDADFSVKVSADGAAWAEALRIDTAGRVGIGAATPAYPLDVNGKARLTGDLRVENATARVKLEATGSSLSNATTGLNRAGTTFSLTTISGASTWVSTDYKITYDAGGAISHDWRVQNDNATMVLNAQGLGLGTSAPAARLDVNEAADADASRVIAAHAGFAQRIQYLRAARAGSPVFDFAEFASSAGADTAFRFAGDGNGTCDGAWTGGGADYAEYFEWADGNPGGEDRRGVAVVLDGDAIREAVAGEEPIGVISGNPSVVGDGDIGRWKGKYLRDDFGTHILEDYQVVEWTGTVTHATAEVDAEGNPVTVTREVRRSHAADAVPAGVTVPDDAVREIQQRRVLNPSYDPAAPYTPRSERPEWDTVGLMGKLRLRKGQLTGARWVRMRDVSADVEEWLVR